MDINRGVVALRNGLERRESLVGEPYDKSLVAAQLDVAWRHISTLQKIRDKRKKEGKMRRTRKKGNDQKKMAPTISCCCIDS